MDSNDCFVSFAAVSCLKFLFFPLYRSTDFEVHRNWMSIVYQLPVKNWYLEDTSDWTLDYPPLFAWFEYMWSHVAKFFDPDMLDVTNLNYGSHRTVFFMRFSVIVSDLMYFYGADRLFRRLKEKRSTDDPWIQKNVILSMLLLWNPGLLLVDHVHFQYNGFLAGLLLLSIADVFEERYVRAAVWYVMLINFKHIYLYLAPAYFVYFLKNYCFTKLTKDGQVKLDSFSVARFLTLGAVNVIVCLISIGPFIYLGQGKQVLSRLFPVKRGLTHSYWAPNVWALYNFADIVLSNIAFRLGIYDKQDFHGCTTGGLVKECQHALLPSIQPLFTIILALLSISPVFWMVWKQPKSPRLFIQSIILCSFGSFLFGYHVHEKAILMIILPLTITAVMYKEEAKIYTFLSPIGHFSLFPLFHYEGETPIKILLLLLHFVYSYSSLTRLHKCNRPLMSLPEKISLVAIFVLQLFYSFGAKAIGAEAKYPFLPLMLISIHCAVAVLYSWVKYCRVALKPVLLQKTN